MLSCITDTDRSSPITPSSSAVITGVASSNPRFGSWMTNTHSKTHSMPNPGVTCENGCKKSSVILALGIQDLQYYECNISDVISLANINFFLSK